MIGGNQHLLRKAEIERLSSPEQLDTAMRVTSPVGWAALVALGAIIAAVVVWSFIGSLSVRVDGTGMLMRGETVSTVQAVVAGKVAEITVGVGDVVEKDQVVARLELTELESEISTTRARIRDLERQQGERAAQMRSLRGSYQKQLAGLQEQLRNKQDLLSRGLARKQDVLAIEGQIAQIRASIVQTEMQDSSGEGSLNEERRKLSQLEKSLAENSSVASPAAGKVAAILVAEDELVSAGSRLLNLEATEEEAFQVLLFVPFGEGKKVKEEMVVRISPSTVKPEEFGYILGTVDSVSSQPVTPEEVRSTLNNDQLARKFAEDTPFRVRALPDYDDQDRFQWTSAKGSSIDIDSNTPCSAQVIIDKRRPISYVIPKLKEVFGIS